VTGASSPKTLNIKSNGAQGRDDLVVKTDKTGTRIRVDDPRAPPRIGGGIAQAIRKRAPLLTETYVAYGATERLFKECARPGAYEVPQALEKGAEIPTDESGAHIGVGKGWWYESE
jgi:cytochrome b pre-mRNA-processing protein 3